MRNKHLLLWSSLGDARAPRGRGGAGELLPRVAARPEPARRGPSAARRDAVCGRSCVPALRAADRCVTCHVGMAPGEQGRRGPQGPRPAPERRRTIRPTSAARSATAARAARRTRPTRTATCRTGPSRCSRARFAYAGCGSCHTHLGVPDRAARARAQPLFERYDCLACHRSTGAAARSGPDGGGMEGPDLSRVGAAGYRPGLVREAPRQAARRPPGRPWRGSVRPDSPTPSARRSTTFLASRVGAPGLVEAKALFHSLGCRGCHKVSGVGGDDGPDLTREGRQDPGPAGLHARPRRAGTFANWLAEHFRAPADVVPGRRCRPSASTRARSTASPSTCSRCAAATSPRRSGPRTASASSASASASSPPTARRSSARSARLPRPERRGHALPGHGRLSRRSATPTSWPSPRTSSSPRRSTQGRPGRRMPAWGEKDGGLRPEEIASRRRLRAARSAAGRASRPDREPRRWVKGDADGGRAALRAHLRRLPRRKGAGRRRPGAAQQGPARQPPPTRYLVETIRRGRRGTAMQGFASAVHRRGRP